MQKRESFQKFSFPDRCFELSVPAAFGQLHAETRLPRSLASMF